MPNPFVPLFPSAHLLTILGNYWPRDRRFDRFPITDRLYQTEPNVKVLVREQHPEGVAKGSLLMVHGLEGSSEAGYMVSMARRALEAGYAAHRMNIRSCGGTEGLCDTLYHAGLTSDARYVAERLPPPVWFLGYSLGGNVVLKLAAELGKRAQDSIAGVIAVSAPIDLAASVAALERPENRIYDWRFVRRMKRRMRERCAAHPGRFSVNGLDGIRRLREFDDRITAPFFGFQDAAHYYATQSAIRTLDAVQVPTLLLSAADDPLVPARMFQHPAVRENPCIECRLVAHGGHLGFIARRRPRFWLDETLLEWIEETGNKWRARRVSNV